MRLLILAQLMTRPSTFNSFSYSHPPHLKKLVRPVRNSRGQSLIEYLLLVAIMAVATMSIIRVVGQNVAAQYGNVARALQGGDVAAQKAKMTTVDDSMTRKRDMATFLGD